MASNFSFGDRFNNNITTANGCGSNGFASLFCGGAGEWGRKRSTTTDVRIPSPPQKVFGGRRGGNAGGSGDNEDDDDNNNNNTSFSSLDYDGTDAEMAREMNELSVQERERVMEEIHGVADFSKAESHPEFVRDCLREFEDALQKLPKSKRKVMDKAIFLRPNYQNDTKLKMMFLRAESYNAEKAVHRMIKFFDWKLEIFGEEKLGKDITLNDLDPKDIEVAVLSGLCLELPDKDPTGRPVTMFDTSKFDHNTSDEFHLLRFVWYMVMAVLEDEVAQLKGFTNLTYTPHKRSQKNTMPISKARKNLLTSGEMMSSLPVRVTGYHYCTDDPTMHFILSMIRIALGKQIRLRIRSHYGSDIELKYSLLTFGINCGDLLSCGDGKTKLHDEYLQRRRDKEQAMEQRRNEEVAKTGIVDYPNQLDALIGRGRPYHDFSGTRRLIELIDSELDRYYQSNDRFWKTCINIEIVKKIQESGGRFLQRSPQKNGWTVLDDTIAREKTANLFRYRYNILNKQQQNTQQQQQKATTSSTMNNNNSSSTAAPAAGTKRVRGDVTNMGGGDNNEGNDGLGDPNHFPDSLLGGGPPKRTLLNNSNNNIF